MEVKSVQEYISLIEKLKRNYTYLEPLPGNPSCAKFVHTPTFIFRGHSNHEEYLLLPGIFRWKNITDWYEISEYSQMEHNILNDFISEACRFIKDIPRDDIPAWLEIAQHFGVPTRLLDFTENPLVALYFACSESPEADASVWIVDEIAYHKKFFYPGTPVPSKMSQSYISKIVLDEIVHQDFQQEQKNLKRVQYPWIYKPHYYEERMHFQSSIFMLWGAKHRPLTDFIAADEYMEEEPVNNKEKGIVFCVQIPANKKKEILNQLDSFGVNEKFIYPGIDGVGRYIKKKYSSKGKFCLEA